MNCPFCAAERRDAFILICHIQRMHPAEFPTVRLFVEAPVVAIELPVVECDVDAIYRKRPDLIKPRSAP